MNSKTKNFISNNKVTVLFYFIIIIVILPLESIGYSHFISDITTSVKGKSFDYNIIYKSVIFIILIFLATRLLHALKYYMEIIIENNLIYYVRTDIFKEIIDKCKKSYDQIEKGKIISYLDVIPTIYEDNIRFLLAKILPEGIAVLVLTVFFYYVDVKLGIIATVMIFFLLITLKYVSKKCALYEREKQALYYENNEHIQDKLSNIFSILTSNKSKNEEIKNNKQEQSYKEKKFKADIQNLKAENIIMLIILIFTIIILLYFIKLFKTKSNKKLVITGFLVYFYYIQYIDNVKWYLIDYFNKMGLIGQYEETLQTKNKIKDGKLKNFVKNGKIEFKNVNFGYKKLKILNNFTFTFLENKLNVILGPSGSGKSTIFKLLLRLADPQSGKILIDGVEIQKASIDYLRGCIGTVNQNTVLFNDTVFKNIAYNDPKITKAMVNKLVSDLQLQQNIFVNITLDSPAGVDGHNLSNGQRQIILILREYLDNKKILLLDEPTSSLDIKSKTLILNILKKLSHNKTIIITTHDEHVSDIADIIVNIKNHQQK
jgi:ABC-type multidrug transport system fused ATPase/permease subunit